MEWPGKVLDVEFTNLDHGSCSLYGYAYNNEHFLCSTNDVETGVSGLHRCNNFSSGLLRFLQILLPGSIVL